MVAITFGTVIVTSIVSVPLGTTQSVGLGTMAFVVVLGYALYRWGSGRDLVLGTAILLLALVVGISSDYTTLGDAVGGFVFMLSPLVLGLAVRIGAVSRSRELDQVRLREREQLARELHDTVAHHVSAMVIRAQAGRVVAATRPEAAAEALAVIEAEGSRTLAEMRVLVGALRDPAADDRADLAPGRGIADIARAGPRRDPRVEVSFTGDLDDLGPAVGAAVYRIAQESVTNAVRHARGAIARRRGGDRRARRDPVHGQRRRRPRASGHARSGTASSG